MDNENSIFRSLEIIESRITEKLTVENIASDVYFSKYHYQRLFRETVGDSVMDYVTKRKLTLAGRALLETDATVLDIALDYGYDSREGFTRSFKAYMGVAPTEYRKYGLAAISQKTVKEKCAMLYSKTTDEILRELNDFIVKAKETANSARKSGISEYKTFWNAVADTTDAYSNKAKDVLEHITAISELPDEITNRFTIIKVIEDIAFQFNLLAFNVGLTVARDQPERTCIQNPLCEEYLELAQTATLKASKIAQFFNELSSLIFDDMRKSAVEKIQVISQKGKAAADGIFGYAYIKNEVTCLVNELSAIPVEDATVSYLDDVLFRLNIISFAASLDVLRNPKDKALFDGLFSFKESLAESVGFFKTLVKPENNPVLKHTKLKHFQDIAFQMSIMLFYTRGEVSDEKLGKLLDEDKKNAFDAICEKMNSIIQFMHSAAEEASYKEIADKLYEIASEMTNEADKLSEHGGAVRFLANEIRSLADRVMKCV